MQNFLTSLAELKNCFSKLSVEQAINMPKIEHDNFCIEEKIKVLKIIHDPDFLSTKNLINERLEILAEQKRQKMESRRAFLNSQL